MTDEELETIREMLLHRTRHSDAAIAEALSKILAEVDRLRKPQE